MMRAESRWNRRRKCHSKNWVTGRMSSGAADNAGRCKKQRLVPVVGRRTVVDEVPGPILNVFPALIVHAELKSVHPGFLVAFIF